MGHWWQVIGGRWKYGLLYTPDYRSRHHFWQTRRALGKEYDTYIQGKKKTASPGQLFLPPETNSHRRTSTPTNKCSYIPTYLPAFEALYSAYFNSQGTCDLLSFSFITCSSLGDVSSACPGFSLPKNWPCITHVTVCQSSQVFFFFFRSPPY